MGGRGPPSTGAPPLRQGFSITLSTSAMSYGTNSVGRKIRRPASAFRECARRKSGSFRPMRAFGSFPQDLWDRVKERQQTVANQTPSKAVALPNICSAAFVFVACAVRNSSRETWDTRIEGPRVPGPACHVHCPVISRTTRCPLIETYPTT